MAPDPLSETKTPLLVVASRSYASSKRTDCVAALLAEGALVESQVQGGPWNGYTALIAASSMGNLPVVQLLLGRGANPNFRITPNGHAALMSAAGYPEVVDALLKSGADLEAADSAGRTAIVFAGLGGCTRAVEFLKSRGADPNRKDKLGQSASDYLRDFLKDNNAVPAGVCANGR